MLEESIKTSATSGNNFVPGLVDIYHRRTTTKFKGNCLIQDNISFTYRNLVNLLFVYELEKRSRYLNTDFTLGDCLFGAVKLTKNADTEKFEFSGYDIVECSQFLLSNGALGKSSSVYADNKTKDILVLSEGQSDGSDSATIAAETVYSVSITKSRKKVCINLNYNRPNLFCVLME